MSCYYSDFQCAVSSGLFILCHMLVVVHGKSYRQVRMTTGMEKEEDFLTAWCAEADHVLLSSESWGERTEVASAPEEFQRSTRSRAELCCWHEDHPAVAQLGKQLCK